MEWSLLLIAAVLAAAIVATAHVARRRPHHAAAGAGAGPRREIERARAVRAVEDDAADAREAAERLSLEQRPRV